jgi:hypothetical protein
MQLQEFYDYKNQLMNDLLTNEAIVKLLNSNLSMDDAGSLVYTQVFPYEYVPETVQDGKTFICCDVDIQGIENGKTFLAPILYVWVFAHRSSLRLPNGGVITDALCNEICKTINGSRMYGLGELNLYACKRFAPMTDYQGKVLVFHAKDFSRQYDPKRELPANRKYG